MSHTPSRANPRLRLGVILGLLTLYLVWGSTYLAIRFAIETLPPLAMGGWRFVVSGAVLYAWTRLRGTSAPDGKSWGTALLVGPLLFVGGNGLVTLAEITVPSGIVALLVGTVPLWMVTLDRFFFRGPRLGARAAFGLIAGGVGIGILAMPTGADLAMLRTTAALLPLGSAFFWSLGSLLSRRLPSPSSTLQMAAMQMLTGGGALFVFAALRGEQVFFDPATVSARSWLALAYLAVAGSILAFSVYLWMLRVTRPAVVATYTYANPVVALVLGAIFAGEPLGGSVWLATAVILTGVVALALPRRGEQATTGEEGVEARGRKCEAAA